MSIPRLASLVPTYSDDDYPTTLVAGQLKIATTGTAVALTAGGLVNGLVLKALGTNVAAGAVGNSDVTNTVDGTGNGYVLWPGEAVSLAVNDADVVYVNGTAGDGFTWVGN